MATGSGKDKSKGKLPTPERDAEDLVPSQTPPPSCPRAPQRTAIRGTSPTFSLDPKFQLHACQLSELTG